MRASNVCHVTATFALLLLCVKAQDGPAQIEVSPPGLIPYRNYTVKWSNPENVFIAGIFLDLVDQQNFVHKHVQVIQPLATCSESSCPSITLSAIPSPAKFSLTAPLDPSGNYVVELQYTSASVISISAPLVVTTGELLTAATTNGGNSEAPASNTLQGTPQTSFSSTSPSTSTMPSISTTSTGSSPTITASIIGNDNPSIQTVSPVSNSGLSTGAKVGIAIAAVAAFLFILIGALLCLRRRKHRQVRAMSSAAPYTHDLGSTNRDLTAEKEMNVMSSPVTQFTPTNTWGSDFAGATPAPQPIQSGRMSQTDSWAAPGEHVAPRHTDEHGGPHIDENRMSTHSPTSFTGSNTSPPSSTPVPGAVSRKPVAVPVHHLHEPGMSEEEVARVEEEERRLDEAIAEAERRRELQRRDS